MGIFGNAFGWPHLLIILAVILLLFGATRLPALSRSLGQSIKIFRKEVSTKDDTASAEESSSGSAGSAESRAAESTPTTAESRDKD